MSDAALAVHEPAVIVICGITGDLARHKVLPAIYHLFKNDLVDHHTFLVGTSRRETDPQSVIDGLQQVIEENGEVIDTSALQRLRDNLSMVRLDPEQDQDYDELNHHLQQLETKAGTCLQLLFYLSIPPQVFGILVTQLGKHDMHHGCIHGATTSRLLIEKPFGYDTKSATDLITQTAEYFNEDQLYRIDHYLAKETAQNILTFRKQNPLFSHIWNRQHITKVSVTAAEHIGIEGRANFYDQIGALRDVLQSHLMQLLTLTLMEIPDELKAETVHAAKQAVLDSIMPVPADIITRRAIRGQYASYRDEVDKPDSHTDTFAAVLLFSQHPDWQDVPLYLTTGKGLAIKHTSITVDFGPDAANRLEFRIQPNEGITLGLQVKRPGLSHELSATSMEFDYQSAFHLDNNDTLDAYERVLIEAMRGDHTLFTTNNEVLSSWRILQPVIDEWERGDNGLITYESGSDGPDVNQLV